MLVMPSLPEHEWVDRPEAAAELLEKCLEQPWVALDTETTGVDTTRDRVIDWSLAYPGRRVALSGKLLHIFLPLFQHEKIIKIFHNCKFDMHILANSGINVKGPVHDTMVMSRLENTERSGSGGHSLKHLAGDGLFPKNDPRHVTYESPFKGTGKNRIKNYQDLLERDGNAAREYASLDAASLVFVYEELKQRLQEQAAWEGQSMWEFYLDKQVSFTEALYNCERRGVLIDVGYLEEKQIEAEAAITDLASTFNRSAGKVVNLSSPKQLREVFFDKWKKKPLTYTDGGASGIKKPSLGEETLRKWADQGDPNAQVLLEHRKLSKLSGTYLKGLLGLADDYFRVHTTLNQEGTETGRLSSKEPNLQNIPRPKTDVYKIREAFIPPPGKLLIVADYDQLEMKLMADFAEEQSMIDAINTGKDMHCTTAALMYDTPYEAVAEAKRRDDARENLTATDRQLLTYRQNSKTIGFGLIYGEGPNKLAGQLGITFKEAEELIEKFFTPFPGVKTFIEDAHQYVKNHGLVRTLSGRPRHLRSGINSEDWGMVARALRQAVNAIIQGSAADIVRDAMILCEFDPLLQELECLQLLQVHDELMFECWEENVLQAMPRIQELMVQPYSDVLKVKLTAEPHCGFSWVQAK
jgi:DNA polymerase-1